MSGKFTAQDIRNIEWAAAFVSAIMESRGAAISSSAQEWRMTFKSFHDRLVEAIQIECPVDALMEDERRAALGCVGAALESYRTLQSKQPKVAATFTWPGEATMLDTHAKLLQWVRESPTEVDA